MSKAQEAMPAKPNIIFILTYDQPESTLSYMPNIQSRPKDRGRTFTNAFNVYPLCCPSRAIIQRGQYAHNTGIFGNDASLGGGYEIFDQLDREKVSQATLDRLQDRLLRLRGCRAYSCRAAENGG